MHDLSIRLHQTGLQSPIVPFRITVLPPSGAPPTISSTPVLVAGVGQPYVFR